MKHVIFAGILAATLAANAVPATAQTASKPGTSLGSVTINHKVSADGKALPAGTYQVRLTSDEPKPALGQSPESERYVEFVRGGKVIAREVATVVSNADVATLVKGPKPANGAVRVDMLKGNDYVRVWINKGGQNYLIHLPSAA
jgi:hypothetical protein